MAKEVVISSTPHSIFAALFVDVQKVQLTRQSNCEEATLWLDNERAFVMTAFINSAGEPQLRIKEVPRSEFPQECPPEPTRSKMRCIPEDDAHTEECIKGSDRCFTIPDPYDGPMGIFTDFEGCDSGTNTTPTQPKN